eukprot:4038004-Pyramimonas_sp.AAC.1
MVEAETVEIYNCEDVSSGSNTTTQTRRPKRRLSTRTCSCARSMAPRRCATSSGYHRNMGYPNPAVPHRLLQQARAQDN